MRLLLPNVKQQERLEKWARKAGSPWLGDSYCQQSKRCSLPRSPSQAPAGAKLPWKGIRWGCSFLNWAPTLQLAASCHGFADLSLTLFGHATNPHSFWFPSFLNFKRHHTKKLPTSTEGHEKQHAYHTLEKRWSWINSSIVTNALRRGICVGAF